jgi:hypothetical protein
MRRVLVLALAFTTLACNPSKTQEPESTAVKEPPAEPSVAEPVETPAAEDEAFCNLGAPDTWSSCEGQRVKLEGKEPEPGMMGQHPMLNFPDEKGERFQSYLDVQGVQVIVISREEVACQGERTVIGVLRGVDLGGEPGTKESYAGWSVEEAEVTCP